MNSEQFHNWDEVLDRLVAAGVELIYARDPALGVALDVPPPAVDVAHQPAPPVRAARDPGFSYRALRKIYRKLKDNQRLRPLLERVRHEILTRT